MKLVSIASLLATAIVLGACGLPVNKLSKDERQADMQWAFTVFKHNYAPAELKKSSFGVDMSQVEADCVTLAGNEMSNQDFLALFQKCIHSFKDAHVGAQQMNNGLLPEYAQVAHLGFVTMRTKVNSNGQMVDALRIVSPLKGSDTPGAPLVPGDLILSVDGQSVSDYMKQEIVPFINVGQEETNLTIAAFRFGIRTSIDMALPTADDIKLSISRNGSVFDITMPWIRQDLLEFELTQNPPEEEKQGEEVASAAVAVENPLASTFFGYKELASLFKGFDNPAEAVTNRLKFIAQTGYRLAKFNPVMRSLFAGKLDANGEMGLTLKRRSFPMSEKVTDLMSDPIFTAKAVTTDDGHTYAYIQIKNFPAEDKILAEWYRAITAIEDKGIKSVIIDMIDNGGGSLVHGMRMLNMLRKKPLQYPSMQVRLNNNWVTSFKTQAAFGADDYAKTIARRVVEDLEEDMANGRTVSRPISVTVMDPFFLQNPSYGVSDDVNIALMVNEVCVSMCDIFASVFQDNQMGEVIGQRTMGGGGNVTQHGLSPVSKMGMALTESLIISPKGIYLEDNGVTPDVLVDMVADREKGFQAAFQAAYESVTKDLPPPETTPTLAP